ncbi:alanine racemase [Bacillus shivajii]|uniref:alanine racemase n=1 Tax=Bacillus shivajii TaxID=1983719 RepID=UPI001CFB756F|nr:alanine racemase [Bacillus shivajii]UCZ54032.1 alanine racemase [Bacillus shivajii]
MPSYEDIPTPALLIDEEKMQRNIQRMIKAAVNNKIELRPHFKTHKSIWIAKEQLKAGAVGITVAKPSEAELLFKHGVTNILLAFPIVDPKKIDQLLQVAEGKQLIFATDSLEQAKIVNEKADKHNTEQEVWIKVNSGLNRCGTEPGEETVHLAKKISDLSNLKVTGLFTHAGHSYAATTEQERVEIAETETNTILQTAQLCEHAGITIEHRSIGSTPTFEIGATINGITEIRPGNAVFFDGVQAGLGVAKHEEVALKVLGTIVSKKTDRIILDTGSKALTTEKGAHGNESIKGFGKVIHPSKRIEITRLSEEHGMIDLKGNEEVSLEDFSIGEKVEIIPNHACTAVNLYEKYYVLKKTGDISTSPIDARGCSQ